MTPQRLRRRWIIESCHDNGYVDWAPIMERVNVICQVDADQLECNAEASELVRDRALEDAACIADQHWPESGHVHESGSVSCQMSISVMIRRLKSYRLPKLPEAN